MITATKQLLYHKVFF